MIKLEHNSRLLFLGEELSVEFSDKVFLKPRVLRNGNTIVVFKSESKKHPKTILNEWLIERSRDHIADRVKFYAKNFNFQFKRVAIKDTVTRWGSCSSDKNLNFNWRLSFAPLKVLDYVIVHELCHTVHLNHSNSFWEEVERVMPEYKIAEKWLKINGRELSLG
ncbi:MAG: M48 family metallopeptidase [Candidatus Dojkabacteria bacterium]